MNCKDQGCPCHYADELKAELKKAKGWTEVILTTILDSPDRESREMVLEAMTIHAEQLREDDNNEH